MEGLDIEIWTRNAFDVEAVKVTEYNMERVAEWTHGELTRTMSHNSRWYVLVDTARGSRLKQTKVFAGDWVVFAGGQFRHYRHDSIKMVYHKRVDPREKIRELLQNQYRDGYQSLTMNPDWFIEEILRITGGEEQDE